MNQQDSKHLNSSSLTPDAQRTFACFAVSPEATCPSLWLSVANTVRTSTLVLPSVQALSTFLFFQMDTMLQSVTSLTRHLQRSDCIFSKLKYAISYCFLPPFMHQLLTALHLCHPFSKTASEKMDHTPKFQKVPKETCYFHQHLAAITKPYLLTSIYLASKHLAPVSHVCFSA